MEADSLTVKIEGGNGNYSIIIKKNERFMIHSKMDLYISFEINFKANKLTHSNPCRNVTVALARPRLGIPDQG